jgi:hypothetical protein
MRALEEDFSLALDRARGALTAARDQHERAVAAEQRAEAVLGHLFRRGGPSATRTQEEEALLSRSLPELDDYRNLQNQARRAREQLRKELESAQAQLDRLEIKKR